MLQIYNLNTDVLFHWINLKKEINRINLQIYYIILEIIRLEISNYVDSKKKVFNYTFNYLEVIKFFKILILFLIIIKKNIKLNSSLFVDWIYNKKNEQREELNNCC